MGIHAEACKHIEQLRLDDTFYIVDLGNVLRMYKVKMLSLRGLPDTLQHICLNTAVAYTKSVVLLS